MLKRIVVGLGGTPFTTVSTRCATELADRHHAQATGVTVVDISKWVRWGPYLQVPRSMPSGCAKRESVTREGIEAAVAASRKAAATSKWSAGASSTNKGSLHGHDLRSPLQRPDHIRASQHI